MLAGSARQLGPRLTAHPRLTSCIDRTCVAANLLGFVKAEALLSQNYRNLRIQLLASAQVIF